jgi:PAS domain S-box-containing protein
VDQATLAVLAAATGTLLGAGIRVYRARTDRNHTVASTAKTVSDTDATRVIAAMDFAERAARLLTGQLERAQQELSTANEEIARLREDRGRYEQRAGRAEQAEQMGLERQRQLDAEIVMLRASSERDELMRGVLDASPDAMLLVNNHGVIEMSNQRADQMFRRGALRGLPVDELVPDRARDTHASHRESYMAEPRTRPMGVDLSLSAVRGDGTEFPVEIGLAPFQRAGAQTGVVASVRDMTARRRDP